MISAKWQYTLLCVFLYFSILGISFAADGFEDLSADVLSPNLDAPQAVEFSELTLPLLWGSLKH